MSNKLGPNDLCPCGSGKKYKKCCNGPAAVRATAPSFSAEALEKVLELLEEHMESEFTAAADGAYQEMWAEVLEDYSDLPESLEQQSQLAFSGYFCFDWAGSTGERVLDSFFATHPDLSDEERAALETLAKAPLDLYEVVAAVRGSALTLRPRVGGRDIVVHLGDLADPELVGASVAARVMPVGPGGLPAIGLEFLVFSGEAGQRIRADLDLALSEAGPGETERVLREHAPALHAAWVEHVDELLGDDELDDEADDDDESDGEEIEVWTIHFEAEDQEAVRQFFMDGQSQGFHYAEDVDGWEWRDPDTDELVATIHWSSTFLQVMAEDPDNGEALCEEIEDLLSAVVKHGGLGHQSFRLKQGEGDEPDEDDSAAPDAQVH